MPILTEASPTNSKLNLITSSCLNVISVHEWQETGNIL